MMMGQIETGQIEWFAVRMKRPQNPNRRTTVLGAEYEDYRNRAGQACKRRVTGTGRREFVPEIILRKAGFLVFLPVRKEWRRVNRFKRGKELVAYPLLTDWLFVGWPSDQCRWADLMALDVVAGVMGTGGRPVRLPEERVSRLMQRWGSDRLAPEAHRWMRTHAEFGVGDRARVVDGPLDGQELRVVEVGGPSVKGLLDILGGEVQVEIEADALEKVERETQDVVDARESRAL